MAFDFSETLTLALPDVEESLSKFSNSEFTESHGLIIEIAAIHEGTTSNYNHYSEAELEASLPSWTTPYEKPIILNHDVHTEPLGRVIGARMAKESDGRPFVMLQVAITSPEAIQKVKDKRYLTGSVGGKAEEAVCNICNKDWASYEGTGLPCAHRRGKSYRGKIAHMDMRKIGFKEYSFVNVPADSHSSVRSILTASEAEAEDVSSQAHFFALDMRREGIVEYTESGTVDSLANMKKKEATPLYLKLKGAFLSALAIEEAEKGVKADIDNTSSSDADDLAEETSMANANTDVQDDILSVVEGLEDEETPVAEEAEETAESDDETEETAEVTEEESTDESEEVEEGERPEGQETPGNKDVDPDTSEGAPVSRESDDESTDESEEVAESETETEEQTDDAELSEEEESVTEPLVEELKSEVEALKEENARLKKALHKKLAEQAVDAKIAAGVIEATDRKTAIEEHVTRTPQSLADSIRDFASVAPTKRSTPVTPEIDMEEQSEVVGDEEQVVTIDSEESESSADPKAVAEDILVDALMGRTSLQF